MIQTFSKGLDQELIDAVVELKRRNVNRGCPRIAQQITLAFGLLAHLPRPPERTPLELDLFRCKSASLHTHWVLVVINQYSCRIVGFSIERTPDAGHPPVSADHSPANLSGYRWQNYCRGLYQTPIAA
jgi:hypothetical protein